MRMRARGATPSAAARKARRRPPVLVSRGSSWAARRRSWRRATRTRGCCGARTSRRTPPATWLPSWATARTRCFRRWPPLARRQRRQRRRRGPARVPAPAAAAPARARARPLAPARARRRARATLARTRRPRRRARRRSVQRRRRGERHGGPRRRARRRAASATAGLPTSSFAGRDGRVCVQCQSHFPAFWFRIARRRQRSQCIARRGSVGSHRHVSHTTTAPGLSPRCTACSRLTSFSAGRLYTSRNVLTTALASSPAEMRSSSVRCCGMLTGMRSSTVGSRW
mmetsp:Transcript_26432/g.91928  ORF Transcript_26432/g.91928 Transcript_26432/m.91928 type:complete len:284 (-) Transcript_26432:3699-4550(-)